MTSRDRDHGCTVERAEAIRRHRKEAVSAAISWAAIALLLAALAPHFFGGI